MPILKKLQKFFEDNKVKYETIQHKIVFTAHDKAATLKIAEKIIGKTLVVKLDKSIVLVLIPANKNLDITKFLQTVNKWKNSQERLSVISRVKRGSSRYSRADFVKEAWMKKNLKGVKIGSVPPFGALWKLPTFIDRGLMQNKKIIVSSGDYKISLKMNPAILKKLIPDLVSGNFSKTR